MLENPPRPAVRYPTDRALLAQALRPYRAHCRYLKSATVTAAGDPAGGGRISVAGEFEIPESCYIDDTGHFNSVEFNICYNQMFYYLAAKSVVAGLAAPFSGWTMDEYQRRQLSDFLIVDFRSTFRRSMRGRRFSGEVAVVSITEWSGSDLNKPLAFVHTECRYWDEGGGRCHGEVRLAILDSTGSGG